MTMADALNILSFIAPPVKNTLGLAKVNNWGNRMVAEIVDFIAGMYRAKQ